MAQGIASVGNIFPSFNNKMFGHAGVGGAVAFGDPQRSRLWVYLQSAAQPQGFT